MFGFLKRKKTKKAVIYLDRRQRERLFLCLR